jgi:hypothetical protein
MADPRDWTFVLRQGCDECGHDTRSISQDRLATALHDSVDQWVATLIGPDAQPARLMVRPSPGVWSPIEYASHVADVMDVFQERIYLMLTEDNPTFVSIDPDAMAAAYAGRTPSAAAALLTGASNRLGDVFASLAPQLWERPGRRADGAQFSVLSLAQYFMHDNLHHLFDVNRQLGQATAP